MNNSVRNHTAAEESVKELQNETSLKSDKFLLIVHDTVEEVKRAHEILEATKVEDTASYMAPVYLVV
jgi:hypothetical protein